MHRVSIYHRCLSAILSIVLLCFVWAAYSNDGSEATVSKHKKTTATGTAPEVVFSSPGTGYTVDFSSFEKILWIPGHIEVSDYLEQPIVTTLSDGTAIRSVFLKVLLTDILSPQAP